MSRRTALTLLLAALPAAAGGLAAQSPAAAPQFGCPGAEHRQFDFWVGTWNVSVQGQQAGTNRITLEEQGCLLIEHWSGARGGTGQSFNFFDRNSGQWHQLWVDNQGNVLRLAGAFADGQMRFTGVAPGRDGQPRQQRLTFTRNPDGTVRQLWEQSADGKDWQVVFDGLYQKQ